MKHYFILEDHKEQAEVLGKIIHSYQPNTQITIAISVAEALQKLTECTYDVFFLDIQLSTEEKDSGNGISFGKLLRTMKNYTTTPIIYVTSFSSYINEAINSVHCYGFLHKPYLATHVYELLDSLSEIENFPSLRLKNSDCVYFELLFTDLIYISSHLHYLNYHTQNVIHRSRQYTMKELETVLPHYFIRCHKSYWVNRNFISSYDTANQCIRFINHSTTIPVGRNYRDALLQDT